jgi:2-desacetyl-2-hydroxyethyl bacteriochlorophyllide A dehydrogenase
MGPHDVLVRLAGSGLCGSNLPVWEGRPWFHYPFEPGAPGHEGWGSVEAVGEAVTDLTPGTPVALLSQHAFADYDVTRAADVVALPASLAGQTFPGEALACAVNVMRRANVEPGTPVAVVGVGFLGAAIVALAVKAGGVVTAVSRRRAACAIAAELGATSVVELQDPGDAVARARATNRGEDFAVVFEVTGLQEPLDVAAQLTRTRGKLVIAGYHQDGPRRVDLQLWNWRGIDVINAHERETAVYISGLREAVSLVASGALPLDRLITHTFPLADIGAAFRHAVERPDGFLKAAVITNG